MSKLRVNEISHKTGTGNIAIPTGNSIVGADVGSVYAPGTVLQVQTVTIGPTSQTIASINPVAVTGLSIDFTPIFSDSKILINVQLATNAPHVSSFGIYKDGQPTANTTGTTNSNQPNMQVTTYIGSTSDGEMWCIPIQWVEISGATSMRTYQIYATAGWAGGTAYSLVINNRPGADMASFSTMTIMEIAQ